MIKHEIDIPENLKDNIMFRVIIEQKEFSLIENKIGVKFNVPIKLCEKDVIVKDLEIQNGKLVFHIEEL